MWKFPRVEERYSLAAVAPVIVDVVGDGFYDRCRARDISENGISIFVKHDFKGCDINTEIELHINLPGPTIVKAQGLLRHLGLGQNHYFGIQIIAFRGQGKEQVLNFIRSLK